MEIHNYAWPGPRFIDGPWRPNAGSSAVAAAAIEFDLFQFDTEPYDSKSGMM